VVHRYSSCAWSVFGSVILNLRCLCTVRRAVVIVIIVVGCGVDDDDDGRDT